MKRILIAPLDWGLGHATRCIPVIRELQLQGCEAIIAGSGDSLRLLEKEFPLIRTFMLPGYNPRYPRQGSMVLSMAMQLPHFLSVIREEHRVINRLVRQEKIDAVISDNRYGCWSEKIPSVFITHQSNILMPRRFGWLQGFVRNMSARMINRFTTCWIPDLPDDRSLAGALIDSSNTRVRIDKQYIGWLSRFRVHHDAEKKYDVVAVFSGPEPQRSMVENVVLPQLTNSGLRYRVVRGLPGLGSSPSGDEVINFLDSEKLQEELAAADLIIARSGFSTVMDLQALGAKAVFIPTPGQTEQEYLASRLMEKRIAYYMKQDAFLLSAAISHSKNYSGFKPGQNNALLKQAIANLIVSSR
jgi:uncharacterized protein (TIGR00661 family)